MTQDVNTRAVVLDILLENEKNPGHSHCILRQALGKYQYLEKSQRAFITRLAEGSIERRLELDYWIDSVSKVRTTKMKPVVRNCLRMSLYQMKYMDKVPVSAVCNEAVKLVQKRGLQNLKGFTNGVLRNLARKLDELAFPDEEDDFVMHCSIKYSMPEWLVKHFVMETSKEQAKAVFEGFQQPKRTYVRCNIEKISPEKLRKKLEDEGVCVTETIVPYAYLISGYDYLEGLESFRQGFFQVQDLSSVLAGLYILPKENDFILDICAAPGGKAMHAAQRIALNAFTNGTGSGGNDIGEAMVLARDVSQAKADLMEVNIERLGIKNVSTEVWDATVRDERMVGTVDWLIADVPCSGLGMLGRKADIRYTVTPKGIENLIQLQRDILSASLDYVKPGGALIYSTCTINSRENQENVRWMIDNFPFELVDSRLLLPGIEKTDGFYMAYLKRKA